MPCLLKGASNLLKRDEIFVKDCLIEFFGSDTTRAEEGEDPPDIYLIINNQKIAVEITRLSPISFDKNGHPQNRSTEDNFGCDLCDELDLKLKEKVPSKIDIVLTLHVPVTNARSFKKKLLDHLNYILDKGVHCGDEITIDVAGSSVAISIIANRQHSKKKIVGVIMNNNSRPELQLNADLILANRIMDKVRKCENILHQGDIWLALLNDFRLADHDSYSRSLKNIPLQHNFKRIYLVSDTGTVSRLF
jgi:hypothetical protein